MALNKRITVDDNLKIIDEMASFGDDWNGYGAKPFSDKAIETFRYVISCLDVQPSIAPAAANSIYMQYADDDTGTVLAYELSGDCLNEVAVIGGDFSTARTSSCEMERCGVDGFVEQINDTVHRMFG